MSIVAKIPAIDDRTYADIVSEARQRIPRYTPEWTDFNAGDTGMALIELFAWMSELLIYRTNRMPELAQLKFLELMGFNVNPARPASAYVTMAVESGWPSATVDLPRRSQFAADNDAGPIIFETERPLVVFAPVLDRVHVLVGGILTDQTATNLSLQGLAPFGESADPGSALTLGFAYDGAFPARTELCLTVFTAPESDSGAVACGKPQMLGIRFVWEYFDGHNWRPMTLLADETFGLRITGQIFIKTPEPAKMRAAKLNPQDDRERYWIRARLEQFDAQIAPRILSIRTNTALATQGETVEGEILGGSNATANQVFQLANHPVLEASLDLAIDEGEGFKHWVEVDEFVEPSATTGFRSLDPEARAQKRYYLLDRSAGEILLGDGTLSHAPVVNVERPRSNVRANSYRYGGGVLGNVGAAAISTLLSPVPGVDAAQIANIFAAAGGTDEETLDQAKARAARALKARDRAVTNEDFEVIALGAGPVGRVKALPLFNPESPALPTPGVVTVVVVPQPAQRVARDAAGEADAQSRGYLVPTPGLLRQVCACLDRARLLTTEVYVIPPVYRQVTVAADVFADGTVDESQLTQDLTAALDRLFDPLNGGLDGNGWPFGGTIYFSWLHRALLVPGVSRLGAITITVDGDTCPPCTDVPIGGASTLLFSGEHAVSLLIDEEAIS
ncbi:putative baseplate assembly protein [Bradyrhizobium niftali]|uniref:Putative baseplate assembly protein n=1 Tax=Bradyrhizobium niftali TaxID=2560055 RepID=A0A4Y9M3K5_9BRAD|nr:putative baseplate assembly protein [Bradyrhizobium niftali]TFV49627.1 putative baseplate assembly protein [Bradyrhizobium niftali]